MQEVAELTTTKYYYQHTAAFENNHEFYGWQVPFTTKNFIIAYDGIIHAGVDLNKVTVQIEDNVITISLPDSKILAHEINEQSLKVLDERESIFNKIQLTDFTDFSIDQKAVVEK